MSSRVWVVGRRVRVVAVVVLQLGLVARGYRSDGSDGPRVDERQR